MADILIKLRLIMLHRRARADGLTKAEEQERAHYTAMLGAILQREVA